MSLTPSFSFTWLWALESSWSQCLWGLGGGHHFVCLEILVLQQGWSSKGQLSFVLTYVITDRCIWLPTFFSYFSASLLLTLLHSGAIPPLVAKTRGLNEDFSMLITFWLEYEVEQLQTMLIHYRSFGKRLFILFLLKLWIYFQGQLFNIRHICYFGILWRSTSTVWNFWCVLYCHTSIFLALFFILYIVVRPITSLGHQERRRVFWKGPKVFEVCPIFSKYIQHIFPGEKKIFSGGHLWLQTWL